jgi:hypothetical protein
MTEFSNIEIYCTLLEALSLRDVFGWFMSPWGPASAVGTSRHTRNFRNQLEGRGKFDRFKLDYHLQYRVFM